MSGLIARQSVMLKSDTVTAALKRLGTAIVAQKLEAALVAGALLVVDDAKRRAPFITGTLSRSIHVGGHTGRRPPFNPGEGYSDIGGNVAAGTRARVLIGTNLVYAARVEFGFMGEDSLGRTYHQQPRPYLRSAWDENLQAMEATIIQELDKLLREALR